MSAQPAAPGAPKVIGTASKPLNGPPPNRGSDSLGGSAESSRASSRTNSKRNSGAASRGRSRSRSKSELSALDGAAGAPGAEAAGGGGTSGVWAPIPGGAVAGGPVIAMPTGADARDHFAKLSPDEQAQEHVRLNQELFALRQHLAQNGGSITLGGGAAEDANGAGPCAGGSASRSAGRLPGSAAGMPGSVGMPGFAGAPGAAGGHGGAPGSVPSPTQSAASQQHAHADEMKRTRRALDSQQHDFVQMLQTFAHSVQDYLLKEVGHQRYEKADMLLSQAELNCEPQGGAGAGDAMDAYHQNIGTHRFEPLLGKTRGQVVFAMQQERQKKAGPQVLRLREVQEMRKVVEQSERARLEQRSSFELELADLQKERDELRDQNAELLRSVEDARREARLENQELQKRLKEREGEVELLGLWNAEQFRHLAKQDEQFAAAKSTHTMLREQDKKFRLESTRLQKGWNAKENQHVSTEQALLKTKLERDRLQDSLAERTQLIQQLRRGLKSKEKEELEKKVDRLVQVLEKKDKYEDELEKKVRKLESANALRSGSAGGFASITAMAVAKNQLGGKAEGAGRRRQERREKAVGELFGQKTEGGEEEGLIKDVDDEDDLDDARGLAGGSTGSPGARPRSAAHSSAGGAASEAGSIRPQTAGAGGRQRPKHKTYDQVLAEETSPEALAEVLRGKLKDRDDEISGLNSKVRGLLRAELLLKNELKKKAEDRSKHNQEVAEWRRNCTLLTQRLAVFESGEQKKRSKGRGAGAEAAASGLLELGFDASEVVPGFQASGMFGGGSLGGTASSVQTNFGASFGSRGGTRPQTALPHASRLNRGVPTGGLGRPGGRVGTGGQRGAGPAHAAAEANETMLPPPDPNAPPSTAHVAAQALHLAPPSGGRPQSAYAGKQRAPTGSVLSGLGASGLPSTNNAVPVGSMLGSASIAANMTRPKKQPLSSGKKYQRSLVRGVSLTLGR